MALTWYFVFTTRYALILAMLLVAGCDSPSNAPSPVDVEPSFAEQAAGVRDGKSDRVQVEAAALTEDDLAGLAGLTGLRELLADHPEGRVTVAGVKHVVGLPNLQHLRIRGPGIDDSALAEIATIDSLRILNLPRGEFSDAGLGALRQLPQLEQLRFGSPHVTDEGIKALAEFPALKRLHLIGVPMTDAGLAELAKIEQLESLYVDDIPLSDSAWESFYRERDRMQKAVHVHIDQEHHDRDPHKHPH